MKEDKFKKMLKNKYHNISYGKKIYESFNKYIKQNKIKITDDNFIEYFNNILFEEELAFKETTKKEIERSCGSYCILCYKFTFIQEVDETNKKIHTSDGEACHIISASKNGPRTDHEIRLTNPEYIMSSHNGVWACRECHHRLIDNKKLEKKYTESFLEEKRSELQLKLPKMNLYKNIPEHILDNLNPENVSEYFDSFKSKEEFLKNLSLNDCITGLDNLSNDLYYQKKGDETHIIMKPKDASVLGIRSLFKDFDKDNNFKITALNVFNSKNGKSVVFDFGIVKEDGKLTKIIDNKLVFMNKIPRKDIRSYINPEYPEYDILNNDVYIIQLSDNSKLYFSEHNEIIYCQFNSLANQMIRYNGQRLFFSINGKGNFLKIG